MAVPRRSQEDSTTTIHKTQQAPPQQAAPPNPQHVPTTTKNGNEKEETDIERVLSVSTTNPTPSSKDHMNYNRVDAELAKYANAVAVDISSEENARLKKLIDRRVLPIMIFTYFLQALDKGTM
jgi:hypothetical protein